MALFVLLCTIVVVVVVVVVVVISLLFHCIFNLIHLFGYPSRKCVIKSVFSVQLHVFCYFCTVLQQQRVLISVHNFSRFTFNCKDMKYRYILSYLMKTTVTTLSNFFSLLN